MRKHDKRENRSLGVKVRNKEIGRVPDNCYAIVFCSFNRLSLFYFIEISSTTISCVGFPIDAGKIERRWKTINHCLRLNSPYLYTFAIRESLEVSRYTGSVISERKNWFRSCHWVGWPVKVNESFAWKINRHYLKRQTQTLPRNDYYYSFSVYYRLK